MRSDVIMEWQHRFRAQPRVWYVCALDEAGNFEPTGNYYDSKEAAEVEANWRSGRVQVHSANLHTLELAQQRWKPRNGG